MQRLQRHTLQRGRSGSLPHMPGEKRLCRSRRLRSQDCGGIMNRDEIKGVWERFCGKNDFRLNPDEEHVEMVIDGLLENEKACGLKLCPCRLRDGSRERDLQLICPCNFKAQDTWRTKGQCWCGLFVKK
ncbi:MAG TPA: hypothetical protein ENN13_03715 [Candidatus Altiarchaeales archaeon]|nr:hypothetical protein [Candidatus Altiarchaeales archaeon]